MLVDTRKDGNLRSRERMSKIVFNNSRELKEPKQQGDRLYERDYYLWLKQTAELIVRGNFTEVDTVNLVEEIEDMGRSEKRAIKSNLIVVLLHLLKYKYQPNKRSNSWGASIAEHRRRLLDDFDASPSLKPFFGEVFEDCYLNARKQAMYETGLPLNNFPKESPFTQAEVLDTEFMPEK